MKQKKIRYSFIFIIVGLCLLFLYSSISELYGYITAKAAQQETIVIRDNQKTHRENISIALGSVNKSCYAVVTPDTIVDKSVTYTSQNPEIMTVQTVQQQGKYYAYMTGIKEGVTRIVATIASGKTYSSYVTVYTAITDTPGIINCSTVLKKTALDTAENFTKTARANDTGTVKGSIGNYLYLDMPAGYLEKGYHIAYIEKEKVTIRCTRLQLDAPTLNLNVNEKRKLKRRVLPALASNHTVTFQSSNKNIAVVSNKGTVWGKKRGTTTITCTAADGSGQTAICVVTVKQPVQKIIVRKASITMQKGQTRHLTASILPRTADNQAVEWSSSNEKIATVDSKGNVTAQGTGIVTITCKSKENSSISAKSKITVVPIYQIKIQDIKELTAGEVVKVQATLTDKETGLIKKAKTEAEKARRRTFIWRSSNKQVATVDKFTGEITAHRQGKFTLTCRTSDGKAIAKKIITVKASGALTNETFKKLPKEKYIEYKYNQSFLLSPNAKGLQWSRLTPRVAQVKDGIVTMKSSGIATIECKKNNKNTKQCKLYFYKKTSRKYGIRKADQKKGIPQHKVSVLGKLTENEMVIVSGGKKSTASESDILLYSTSANRDFFYQNKDTLFQGIHFVNKDTLEFNKNEAIVYNIADDTLYIHINVKFRGDALQDMFTTQGLYGKIQNNGRYQKLVTEAIENTYSLDKVDFAMTPLPGNLKLKVVTKINDITTRQYIRPTGSGITNQQQSENDNYIVIQIGNYQESPNKCIKPTLANGSYWYFTKQPLDKITMKKGGKSLYHYSHYGRKSSTKENRKVIYLPTKEMLKQNVGKYYEVPSVITYKRSVAHEMGHVLGLDDAYEYEGRDIKISRISKRLKDEKLIMRNGKKYDKINSLEIVMLLYARNQSNNKSNISWQSFHNYAIYTHKDSKGIEYYEAGKLSQIIE